MRLFVQASFLTLRPSDPPRLGSINYKCDSAMSDIVATWVTGIVIYLDKVLRDNQKYPLRINHLRNTLSKLVELHGLLDLNLRP